MRISHKKKLIFLSNPKSGSETIRGLLDTISDVKIDNPKEIPGFESYCSANVRHTAISPHSPATVVRDFFNFKGWDWSSYFKFTSLRNPWDKLVSAYHYGKPDRANKYFWEKNYNPSEGIADFKKWLLEKGSYFYPIAYYAYDINRKNCLVDEIIRMEDFNNSLPILLENLGVHKKSVLKTNTTKHKPYSEYYDAETVAVVAEKFKLDVEIGNYSFENKFSQENTNTNDVKLLNIQLNNGEISKGRYYDNLTNLVLERSLHNKSVCIDIGCHIGNVLDIMKKYAAEGEFFIFEPIPNLFKMLKKKYSSKNVHCFELALSNKKGKSAFNYVVSNPGFSGLLKRKYDSPNERHKEISVHTDTLDNIISVYSSNLNEISFIKIDVEGAELQVLQGAKNTINKFRPLIVFEHGLGAADYYATKPESIYDFFRIECNMNLTLLDLWLIDKKPLNRNEFCRQFHNGLNYYFIAYE